MSESNCTTKSEKKMEMLHSSANFLLKFSLHKIPKFMRDAVRAITQLKLVSMLHAKTSIPVLFLKDTSELAGLFQTMPLEP